MSVQAVARRLDPATRGWRGARIGASIIALAAAAIVASKPAALSQTVRPVAPQQARAGLDVMSARDAHKKALSGELVLVDIRTPGEWRETGVAASAVTITMHQPARNFFKQLQAATKNSKSMPIAIICATGSRTTYLQKVLGKYGYLGVINVAEGMFGSRYGRGWIKAGLPIKKLPAKRSTR